jgi:hypothetical protein
MPASASDIWGAHCVWDVLGAAADPSAGAAWGPAGAGDALPVVTAPAATDGDV